MRHAAPRRGGARSLCRPRFAMPPVLHDDVSESEAQAILDGVVAFGDRFAPPRGYAPLRLALRDGDGRLIGGLLGAVVWGWLHVDLLWVDEAARGQGHGARLLAEAERRAAAAGCRHARLDTFDFEARGFYERRGYHVYAELEGFPEGHRQFHLRKPLAASPSP